MLFLRLQGTVLVFMGLPLGVLDIGFVVRFGVFFYSSFTCWTLEYGSMITIWLYDHLHLEFSVI